MSYWAPCSEVLTSLTLFNEPAVPVLIRRISCSFSSSFEVLFSFPLRYLSAIGHSHSYLALDGQHHPYSASTFKLAYSQTNVNSRTSLTPSSTVEAPGYQPGAQARYVYDAGLSTTGPKRQKDAGIQSRANPSSLAATRGISIDFFSSADLYA